jgi:hypothetical protein
MHDAWPRQSVARESQVAPNRRRHVAAAAVSLLMQPGRGDGACSPRRAAPRPRRLGGGPDAHRRPRRPHGGHPHPLTAVPVRVAAASRAGGLAVRHPAESGCVLASQAGPRPQRHRPKGKRRFRQAARAAGRASGGDSNLRNGPPATQRGSFWESAPLLAVRFERLVSAMSSDEKPRRPVSTSAISPPRPSPHTQTATPRRAARDAQTRGLLPPAADGHGGEADNHHVGAAPTGRATIRVWHRRLAACCGLFPSTTSWRSG